jgi:TRAP-type C4-dicarboxylate transport system permease small subunit
MNAEVRFPRVLHEFNLLLAIVAGAMLAFVPLAIIFDVTLRSLGQIPPQWTSAVVEYLNLYIALLVTPWIMERRGHVLVGIFTAAVGPRTQAILDRVILVICILLCATFGIVSAGLLYDAVVTGAEDVRSITLPRWLLFVPAVIAFFSMLPTLVFFLVSNQPLREGGSHDAH